MNIIDVTLVRYRKVGTLRLITYSTRYSVGTLYLSSPLVMRRRPSPVL